MEKQASDFDRSYFAAANSYLGFVSYFPEVFGRKGYTKSFVLKGGPGTGKSTLMKRLAGRFADCRGVYIERIFCSSDPSSLDGVIIGNDKGQICVMDGTAPHVCEAELPSAYDILIPLGEALDDAKLEAQRDVLEEHNERKQDAYARAYENLRFSSIFDTKIKAEYKKFFDFDAAERLCEALTKSISDEEIARFDRRLISSFSRHGLLRFDTLEDEAKKKIVFCGDEFSSAIFLGILLSYLKKKRLDIRLFPRPLDSGALDGILLKKSGLAFIYNDSIAADTDTAEFITDYPLVKSKTNDFLADRDKYLELAKRSFAEASENHFALEGIYTPSMNFDIVNAYYEKIANKVENILLT